MKARLSQPGEKFRIKVINGSYIARIAQDDGWDVWCPIGAVARVEKINLVGMARMARFYFLGGLGLSISKHIARERGDVFEVLTEQGWQKPEWVGP